MFTPIVDYSFIKMLRNIFLTLGKTKNGIINEIKVVPTSSEYKQSVF